MDYLALVLAVLSVHSWRALFLTLRIRREREKKERNELSAFLRSGRQCYKRDQVQSRRMIATASLYSFNYLFSFFLILHKKDGCP